MRQLLALCLPLLVVACGDDGTIDDTPGSDGGGMDGASAFDSGGPQPDSSTQQGDGTASPEDGGMEDSGAEDDAGFSAASIVGTMCLPEQIPEAGFSDLEAYIETSSTQCEGETCMVFRLAGDPGPDCDTSCTPGNSSCAPCADAAEVPDRVYCTCRCHDGDAPVPGCECPSGYSCEVILEQGSPQVRGSYCVKNGTF